MPLALERPAAFVGILLGLALLGLFARTVISTGAELAEQVVAAPPIFEEIRVAAEHDPSSFDAGECSAGVVIVIHTMRLPR